MNVAAALQAQALPSGWTQTIATADAQEYAYKDGGAQITVVDNANMPLEKLEVVLTSITQGLAGISPACRDIATAPVEAINSRMGRIARSRNKGDECYAMALWADNKMRVVMAMEKEYTAANTIGLAMELLQDDMALPGAIAAVPSGGSRVNAGLANVADVDKALAASVAAVPASRRPIGLISRTSYTMSGTLLSPVSTAWTVFGNGFLTDCTQWDPATIDPTPAGLSPYLNSKDDSCDIAKWRRVGNEIVVTDIEEEGDDIDDTRYTLSNIKPFTRGQYLALDLETTSSFSAQIPGSIAGQYGVTNSRWILSPSGDVRFSQDSYRSDYGDGTSSSGTDVARYYLDGHIMAVRFPDGTIQKKFVGLTFEGGKTYGYLDGEFYWQPDKE
jgi:hypothetical protein